MYAKTLEGSAALALYESGDPDFCLAPGTTPKTFFLLHTKPLNPPYENVQGHHLYEVFLEPPTKET